MHEKCGTWILIKGALNEGVEIRQQRKCKNFASNIETELESSVDQQSSTEMGLTSNSRIHVWCKFKFSSQDLSCSIWFIELRCEVRAKVLLGALTTALLAFFLCSNKFSEFLFYSSIKGYSYTCYSTGQKKDKQVCYYL